MTSILVQLELENLAIMGRNIFLLVSMIMFTRNTKTTKDTTQQRKKKTTYENIIKMN